MIPYLKADPEPFIVLSTGTWSICMNLFNESPLSAYDLERDCLHFLNIHGRTVKASRLFMGEEFKCQVQQLNECFHQSEQYHHGVRFDQTGYDRACQRGTGLFQKFHLNSSLYGYPNDGAFSPENFGSYEDAYHQMVYELVLLQVESLKLVAWDSPAKKLCGWRFWAKPSICADAATTIT
ncbi:MAG: hypothetical protein HC880_02400 [Bacteroidia bacterium]|nr:hypothetical protein [Bacteroidia bacterium]